LNQYITNGAIYLCCVYDNITAITIVVVCVLLQAEVRGNVETAANDSQFPVEVTGGHMRPVVVSKQDLPW